LHLYDIMACELEPVKAKTSLHWLISNGKMCIVRWLRSLL
jgi:hypothetical protein